MSLARLGGHSFALKYQMPDAREAVIAAVARHPYCIALLGWVDAARTPDQLHIFQLPRAPGAAVVITYERSAERAAVVEAIEQRGRRKFAIQADNADATAVERSVREAAALFG